MIISIMMLENIGILQKLHSKLSRAVELDFQNLILEIQTNGKDGIKPL